MTRSKFSLLASSWNIHHHLKRWKSHLHNIAQEEKRRDCVSRNWVKVLSPSFWHFLLSFETFHPSWWVSMTTRALCFGYFPGTFFFTVSTFNKRWNFLTKLYCWNCTFYYHVGHTYCITKTSLKSKRMALFTLQLNYLSLLFNHVLYTQSVDKLSKCFYYYFRTDSWIPLY